MPEVLTVVPTGCNATSQGIQGLVHLVNLPHSLPTKLWIRIKGTKVFGPLHKLSQRHSKGSEDLFCDLRGNQLTLKQGN